jgi:hypothetical protein
MANFSNYPKPGMRKRFRHRLPKTPPSALAFRIPSSQIGAIASSGAHGAGPIGAQDEVYAREVRRITTFSYAHMRQSR